MDIATILKDGGMVALAIMVWLDNRDAKREMREMMLQAITAATSVSNQSIQETRAILRSIEKVCSAILERFRIPTPPSGVRARSQADTDENEEIALPRTTSRDMSDSDAPETKRHR
jgi:hypothetical protein